MFIAAYVGVFKNSRIGDWYVDVDMSTGLRGSVKQIFESLMAFYVSNLVLTSSHCYAAPRLCPHRISKCL